MSDDATKLQRTLVRLLFSNAEYRRFMADARTYAEESGLSERIRQLLEPCTFTLFAVERRGRKKLVSRELIRAFPRTLARLYPDDRPDPPILDEFMDSDEFFALGATPSVWNGLYGYDNRPKFYSWAARNRARYAVVGSELELDFATYLTDIAQHSSHTYFMQLRHGLLVPSGAGWIFVKDGVVIGPVATTEAKNALASLGAQPIASVVR